MAERHFVKLDAKGNVHAAASFPAEREIDGELVPFDPFARPADWPGKDQGAPQPDAPCSWDPDTVFEVEEDHSGRKKVSGPAQAASRARFGQPGGGA